MQNFIFAGIGNRFVAQIIDGLLLGFAMSVILIPIFGIGMFSEYNNNFENPEAFGALMGLAFLPIILVGVGAPVIYDAFMISSSKQATVGMMIMKIKVVDEQGQKLTFGASAGRALIKYVSSNLCILLWLWPLFNNTEQALHDLIVKDYVIRG